MVAAPELVHALDKPAVARSYVDEFELLLACCQQGPERSEGWFSLDKVDWEKFIALADNHQVIPQVGRALEPCSADVPSAAFAVLQEKYRANARSALWFTRELARIVSYFDGRGILAIPYKGPLLAHTLYGDVTARQYHDLDILVLPEEVNRAKAALADLGYVCSLNLRKEIEPAYVSSGYEYSFDGASRPHAVELQWQVLPRFYSVDFDLEACFRRATEMRVGDCSFLNLCPEDLLLILCVHAAKHLWAQVSWLLDLSKLARTMTIDWNSAWERAEGLGIQRIVALNLELAHEFGSSVPDRIHAWFKAEDGNLVLREEIAQRIRVGEECDTQSMSYFRLMSRMRERRKNKARMWWRLLWTPSVSEWNEIRLPQPLFRFYSVVRLLRLAKRFAVPA